MDLFGKTKENIMNVVEVTKDKLQKSIIQRIPEDVMDKAHNTMTHLVNGFNYMQEIVATADL